jgi:mannosyltransferase
VSVAGISTPAERSPKTTAEPRRHLAERRDRFFVAGLTLLALVLRASTINTRGLWLDEVSSVQQASGTLWTTILQQVGGTHPPLFHILMHFWIYVFGEGEIEIRSLALLFGVLCVPAAYWAGKRVHDGRVGLITAAIYTFSPFNIWYSQEARMYSMLAFFSLLSVGFFALAIDTNSKWSWTGYFVASLLGAFTHYLFFFLLAGQAFYFVVFEVIDREVELDRRGERTLSWRRPWRLFADVPKALPWLIVGGVLGILIFLWLKWAVFFPPGGAALVGAVTTTGLGYAAPPPSWAIRFNDVVETLMELIFGSHSPSAMSGLVAMWPLFIYVSLMAIGGGRYITRRTTMLLCSMAGMLAIWAFGQYQGVVLLSRYLTPMVAPAFIFVAGIVSRLQRRARVIVMSLMVVISLVAFVSQSFDTNSVLRYQNREVIEYVGAHQQPGDVIIYEPFYIDSLINYYLPGNLSAYGFPRFAGGGQFRDSDAQVFQDLARIIGPAPRVWVIRSFQNVPSIGFLSYKTDLWFYRNGYRLGEHKELNKAEFTRFDSVQATGTPTGGGTP